MMGKTDEMVVKIRLAENGCIVTVCDWKEDEMEEHTYVYKDLKSALKEVPSLFDVAQNEAKDKKPMMSEKDLNMEEKAVNSSTKKEY